MYEEHVVNAAGLTGGRGLLARDEACRRINGRCVAHTSSALTACKVTRRKETVVDSSPKKSECGACRAKDAKDDGTISFPTDITVGCDDLRLPGDETLGRRRREQFRNRCIRLALGAFTCAGVEIRGDGSRSSITRRDCVREGTNASAFANNAETATLALNTGRSVHAVIPLRQFQFPDCQEARNHFSILDIRVVDACNLGKPKARWGVSVPRSDNRDERFES
ncbi:hypothetical protein V8E53_012508 [Lactarius tabidus]